MPKMRTIGQWLCVLPFLAAMVGAGEPALGGTIPGTWRAVHTAGGGAYQHLIQVRKHGAQFMGVGVTWFGMTEAQAQAAVGGQKPKVDPRAMCVQQQFAITLEGTTLTFKGVAATNVVNGGKYNPDIFSGSLGASGVVAGGAEDAKKSEGIFRLWKDDALKTPQALELAKGKTHALPCLDDAKHHYSCYIPKSYDPAKPTPVLINFSPSGNAQPLSVKMAEETGWIMAGLTESKNGPVQPICESRDAAFFDLRRRFNIDLKRVYFSGLSGGARSASFAGVTYPEFCAGMILVGAAYADGPPPKEQPIFFIAGETDMNKGEVKSAHDVAIKAGRKASLIIHPGGHTWGRKEDHDAAVKWLFETSGPQGEAKKK